MASENLTFVPLPVIVLHPSGSSRHLAKQLGPSRPSPNISTQFSHHTKLDHASSTVNFSFQPPFPNPKPNPCYYPSCTFLWLRLGDLRLADNPALTNASVCENPVLPILILSQNQLSSPVLAAVAELRESLTRLSSLLITRVVPHSCVQSHVAALCEVVDVIRPNRIMVNDIVSVSDRSALSPLKQRMVSICNFNSSSSYPSYFSDAPQSFPPPPHASKQLLDQLDIPRMSEQSYGEKSANIKLSTLLASRSCAKAELFLHLREELHIGSISKQRIIFQWQKARKLKSRANPVNAIKKWPSPLSAISSSIPSPLVILQLLFKTTQSTPAIAALSVTAYDVNGGDRRGVKWDEETKSFVLQEWEHTETERRMNPKERIQEFVRRRRQFLTRAFFPDDVTPDYYSFTAWRFAQRCVSATIGVFGTSSLLVALGIRSGRIGQAAVISWVLKDGLGRVGKMIWAGSMGKDFDVDPKRWRFRSALLYALGNGLEIVTQIFPASFLVFATAANSMKQVSMLTSSATRNAMYRSFGERTQNIANITAKGEAQIVVADLIGMGCGIRLSKLVGSSRANVLGSYFLLTLLDVFGIYMELRSVVFRSLNAERSSIIINRVLKDGVFLSPSQVSPRESIFLKPKYKSWVRMTSIAKAGRNPEELSMLLRVFKRERFMVSTPSTISGGPCRLVLRNDATNEDVLRAMLLVGHLQRELRNRTNKDAMSMDETERLLWYARSLTKRSFPWFVEGLKEKGWNVDNLLFSTMKRRGYWRSGR